MSKAARNVPNCNSARHQLSSLRSAIRRSSTTARRTWTRSKGELLIHRQNNQGHDSAKLQQRFSDNRNRLLALEHAQTLWESIASG